MDSAAYGSKRRDRSSQSSSRSRAKRAKRAANCGTGTGEDVLLQEAFAYLSRVKETFCNHPEVYSEFTTLLKEFRDKRVAINAVVCQVQRLFVGHEELLSGFKVFLPVSYHAAYAEEVRRHRARLAANTEREQLAAENIPLHFLSALSNDPGTLQNHALSLGLPPGVVHLNSPDGYFGLTGPLINPMLTLDRIPVDVAAVSPFSSAHVATFFSMKVASDLHILDAIHRGIEFAPLPIRYKPFRRASGRRSRTKPKAAVTAPSQPRQGPTAEGIEASHSAVDGVATRSRAAMASGTPSKSTSKPKLPTLEGMLDITSPEWGGSLQIYRQSLRRRKLPNEAYVICDYFWQVPQSESEDESSLPRQSKGKSVAHEARREKMRRRQNVLSNASAHPVPAQRCQQYLHRYKRPSPDDAVDLLYRVKEECSRGEAGIRKFALFMRYLHKYFLQEMDVAKLFIVVMKLFRENEEIQELLKPFFPGLEGIGETPFSSLPGALPQRKSEKPASDDHQLGRGARRSSRKAPLYSLGEEEDGDYHDAEDPEDDEFERRIRVETPRSSRPVKKVRTQPRRPEVCASPVLKSPAEDAEAMPYGLRSSKRRSPISSEGAFSPPQGSDSALLAESSTDALVSPANLVGGCPDQLRSNSSSPPSLDMEPTIPIRSLRHSDGQGATGLTIDQDPGTVLHMKVEQAKEVLTHILELESHNMEKMKLPPSRRTRSRASKAASQDPEGDKETEGSNAKRTAIWDALEEPCRQLFEDIYSMWKAETLLNEMFHGSVPACQEAAIAVRKHLEACEAELKKVQSGIPTEADHTAEPSVFDCMPMIECPDIETAREQEASLEEQATTEGDAAVPSAPDVQDLHETL